MDHSNTRLSSQLDRNPGNSVVLSGLSLSFGYFKSLWSITQLCHRWLTKIFSGSSLVTREILILLLYSIIVIFLWWFSTFKSKLLFSGLLQLNFVRNGIAHIKQVDRAVEVISLLDFYIVFVSCVICPSLTWAKPEGFR